jgi:hypothetical protein
MMEEQDIFINPDWRVGWRFFCALPALREVILAQSR